MTTFDDREKSFEKKFVMDEEMRFKATARRNKLLGLWAAEKLGKKGEEAEAYAKEIVMADLHKPGEEDLIEKLVKDFAAAGQNDYTNAAVREEIDRLDRLAVEAVRSVGPVSKI